MKMKKRMMMLSMVLVMMLSTSVASYNSVDVHAASPLYLQFFRGVYSWSEGWSILNWHPKTYKYSVYWDPTSAYQTRLNCCVSPTISHTYGRPSKTIKMSLSLTVAKETTSEYSLKAGGSLEEGPMKGLLEFSRGETYTTKLAFAIDTSLEWPIETSDPTGSYAVYITQNHDKYVLIPSTIDSKGKTIWKPEKVGYVPYGRPYLCLAYSRYSSSDWKDWKKID